MAAKKIGAIIALDGEKEFKQNVTSCNKSLSSLKSEMGLVKAQCEGQENSLQSLSKKHEVLIKVLGEQKNKEEAVRAGLDHAKQSYEKVGVGLDVLTKEQQEHAQRTEELKEAYAGATKKLDEMKKSGEASKGEIKQQEATVKSLSDELKKEEAALKDVSDAISKGEQNYQSAGNRVKDWEAKLNTAEAQVIRATTAVNKNAAYMREAEQSTDKCATSIDAFGKEIKKAEEITIDFGTIVKTNLGNTVVNLVKDAVSGAAASIKDLENAQHQFQASTGATTAEMQRYKTVMNDIHSNNFGDDINDVARSMALVKQYTGELDPGKLQEMTENGIAMRDVFDMDLSETIRGVDALVENMGLTSEEAFDLMAKGAQNGLNKSGELADNITEYSQLWSQAGFSAKEMFAIVDNGLQSGAYNLDKVNDFVKEFSISLADGRIEENIDSFSEGTKTLFYQFKTGKATAKDVFYSVINDLDKTENKQQALTIASTTWSALGEDNAMKVITSLNKTNHAYDDVKGTMEEINNVKYDTLEARFQQLGKKFQTEVATPIVEEALPLMEEGLDLVIDNMDTLLPLLGGVGAGVAAFKTATTAVGLYEAATKTATAAQGIYTATTEGASVAQAIFNAVCEANPIILVATAVVAAGTALAIYAKTAGEATDEVKRLSEQNQRLCDSANAVSDSAEELVTSYADSTAEMKAQGEYAGRLAEKIEDLSGKTNLNSAETEVLRGYIAELNQLMPELNLSYDEQAGKLNMTSEALEEYLEKKQEEIEMQAAQEYAIELLKKRSELEIEAIKLEDEKAEIRGENNEKEISSMTEISSLMNGLTTGNMDYYRSFKELSEAQDENSEAVDNNKQKQQDIQAELEATQAYLEEHGIKLDLITGKTDENTAAADRNSQMMSAAADANSIAAQTITETYTGMQEKVSEVLESQMNMFDEFNAGTEISSEQLLANMQGQIEGVTNWADNMAMLADRGVNQGILEKLAEMGPQGSTYVQAFADMTDEQLQQANDMWSQSLDMKEGVNASVQGMIEEYTVALNGGQEQVNAAMTQLGADSVQGLVQGIGQNLEQTKTAGKSVGDTLTTGAKDSLESHSPSQVFVRIGQDVVSGLTGGISGSQSQVMAAMQAMTQQTVTTAQAVLNSANFSQVGRQVPSGIQEGVNYGKPGVLNSVNMLGTEANSTARYKLDANNFSPVGRQVTTGLSSGIRSGDIDVRREVDNISRTAQDTGLDRWTLYNEGWNVSMGLSDGISAGESYVINAVAQMCANAVSEARSRLDVRSPSKVFEEIGSYTAEGFGIGYEKKMGQVNETIRRSMEIPEAGKTHFSGWTGSDSDIIGLLQEYLPYLQDFVNKQTYMYPSRRAFREEVMETANSGMMRALNREKVR